MANDNDGTDETPEDYESTDRYGGPANWPDPATVCKGPCEGMGVYPENGHFVTCPDCGGTGRRRQAAT